MITDKPPLTFMPSSEALVTLRQEFAWCLPDDFDPIMFSMFGDVFYTAGDASVYWLNTGTGVTSPVANSKEEFERLLKTDKSEGWLLSTLVQELRHEGKIPTAGECFTYAILPVFAEGKYEAWNFKPVPAHKHFGLTSTILRQIRELPVGAKVRVNVTP
jgi:hypothetical protein